MKREVMRRLPIYRNVDNRIDVVMVASRAAVSAKERYCYFRIPKAANSTVVRTLALHDKSIRVDDDDELGTGTKKGFAWAHDVAKTAKELARKHYLFTIVRNPYERLLSAYLDKFVWRGTKDHTEPVRRFLDVDDDYCISFEQFVMYLERKGVYADAHWAPQTALLSIVGLRRLDYVGHVETLDCDLRRIMLKLFGEFKGIVDSRYNAQAAHQRMSIYYNDDLYARVGKLYARDFKSLGYKREAT